MSNLSIGSNNAYGDYGTALYNWTLVSYSLHVMPIIKSAMKRVRQAAKRRSRNLQVKRAIHRDIRAFTDALQAGNMEETTTTLRAAISEIDRAVKKGTVHRNTASRRKSQLMRAANTVSEVSATPEVAAPAKVKSEAKTKSKVKAATKPKAKTVAKAAKQKAEKTS